MKKFLLLLGMVTWPDAVQPACGQSRPGAGKPAADREASLINYSDQVVNALNEIVTGGMQDQYASDAVISAGISSWESAMSDLGAYNGVTDHKVEIGSDEAIVEASVSGADHNAVVTLIINDQGSLSSITVNVERSMGELMLNAALNTLMGMGTVFIILILISLLIGCFKFIPQIQEKFSKKNKQPAAAPAAAPVVAAPVEEEEETSDEELIAVIAAAIGGKRRQHIDRRICCKKYQTAQRKLEKCLSKKHITHRRIES